VYQAGQVLRAQELNGIMELDARLPAKLKAKLAPYLDA
jgi:hypothetical protein